VIRELIGHSAAYTFANMLARGTVLVWLIVLPHFMGAADYGVLGLVMTVAAFVNVLVPLEVSQALARYYPTAPAAEKPKWSGTAWTFTVTMLLIAAAASLVFSPALSRWLFGSEAYLIEFRLAVLYFAVNTSFLFIQNQYRWSFRARIYTFVTMVFAVVTLGLSLGLAAIMAHPLTGVLIGLLGGAAVGVLLGLLTLRGSMGLLLDRAKFRRMLRFSLPLVPASLSIIVSTYASRFILNDLLTLKEVGLFTWASQVANIPAMLLLGVQAAVTPLVMKHHAAAETPATLARSFEAIFAGSLWICIAIGLVTPEFVWLLGYASYVGAGPLVVILAPAYLLLQLYVFFPGFAVAEKTSLQLLMSIISAVAAVVLNYWLVGLLGLMGAAIATFLSSVLFIALWAGLSYRLYPVPLRIVKLGLFVIGAAVCGFAGEKPGVDGLSGLALKALLLVALSGLAAVLGFVRPRQVGMLLAWKQAG
jgi:O-antigen/teichoic acid export membrane protein